MSQYLQKSTAALMIFIALANTVLIILVYRPQKAEAFNPFVFDIPHTIGTIGGWIKSAAQWAWEGIKFAANKAWEGAKWLWEKRQALKGWLWETTKESTKKALSVFRKQTLNYMVNHLANYIQYGGREGGPSFIPDWKTFLYGTGGARDQAIGEFANTFWQNITAELTPEVQAAMENAGISTTNLCEIEPGSWTGLIGAGAPVKTFTSEDVACTAREAKTNLKEAKEKLVKFYDNFGEDGWDTWLEVTQTPQNNPYGFYLTVLDKKMAIEAETTEAEKAKAIAGTGWLGKEQCIKYVNNVHMAKPTVQNITYDTAKGTLLGFDWLTTLNHELTQNDPERKKIVPIIFSVDNLQLGIVTIENTLRDYYIFPENFPEVAREPFITTDAELISNALKDISSLKNSGFTCVDYKVLTPGQLIGQSVARQFGGEIDWLMSTDEMAEYTTALATAGINRLFSEGRGLFGKWLGDDEEADAAEDDYQKFLASLPDATKKQKADQAARDQFSKAKNDYSKFTDYQSGLADDKKQEEISRIAETPAQELLFTLEDLESALENKLKPSLETLKNLQDQDLKIWQKKALGALLGYYFIKNVYYMVRFGKPDDKEVRFWFDKDLEVIQSSCVNEELEREYVIEYDGSANYSGYTNNPACSGKNPLMCQGKEGGDSGMEGLFVRNEKINLIAKRLGKIIGAPVEYPTLKSSLIPYPMQCEDIPGLNCHVTPLDPGCSKACIGYSHTTSSQRAPVYSTISDEEKAEIERQINNGITPWLAKIKTAKDALTTEIHAGLNYLQLHQGYIGIYKWATSINSQDKVILTQLELQGLERLKSTVSHLASWKDQDIDSLEESLEKNEYAKTKEFIEEVKKISQDCKNKDECTEEEQETKEKIWKMYVEYALIYKEALLYAVSSASAPGNGGIDYNNNGQITNEKIELVEDVDKDGVIERGETALFTIDETQINFYDEFIGLNRFKNAIEDNEQNILSKIIPALASTLPEFNDYLGVKSQDSNNKSLDEVIDDTQKATSAIKEKVADIEAGFREMTFETSSPDITPSAVYHKQLQSIINIYNNAYKTWLSCKNQLPN